MKRRLYILVSAVLLAIVTMSCAAAGTPTVQPSAGQTAAATKAAAAPGSWDYALAEGKKEGEVMMYTSISPEARNALSQAVMAKYGIRLDFLVGKGAELSPRILSERGAGLYLADVVNAGGTTLLQSLKPSNVFVDIQPELMLPDVLDAKAWVAGKVPYIDKDRTAMGIIATTQRFVMRNTDLVKADEITSYRDLLNPKWKGKKIVLYDPTVAGGGSSFTAILVQDWGMDAAKDFLKALVLQDPVITRDVTVQVKDTAQGKYPIAISTHVETSAQMIAAGAPLALVTVKDAVKIGSMGAGGLSLPSKAPHPNARKVFVNWLLSKEGQQIFSSNVGLPSARKDVSREGINPTFFALPEEKIIVEDEEHFNLQGTMLGVAKDIFAPLLK